MKQQSEQPPRPRAAASNVKNKAKLAVAIVASCGVALVGWSVARNGQGQPSGAVQAAASPEQPLTPEAILASIPAAAVLKPTAIDGEILKWKEQARRQPDKAVSWVNLGDALMQKGREVVDPHFYDYAEKAYQKALSLDSANAGALTGMAWVSGGRHQFVESIAWAEKALALAPRDHAAYGLIGDAQVEQGDYEAAFGSYQKMLDIRPDISSYSRGAQILHLTGDTSKAIWLMQKAVRAGGPYAENTAWCRAQLVDMLMNTGSLLPAEQVATDALKKTPNNYNVLVAAGRVKEARRDYAGAIQIYQQAVAVSPQHRALVALGDLYLKTGKKAEAEAQFAQVEKTHEEHKKHGSHDELYMARFFADHDRNLPRALAIAETHKDTKNPVEADSVAWCYHKNGKAAEAKAIIDRALAVGAPDASRLFHAGMIYARLGERGPASKYLYQALSINPYFSLLDAPIAAATLKDLGKTPVASRGGGRSGSL